MTHSRSALAAAALLAGLSAAPANDALAKDTLAKDTLAKDTLAKDAPARNAPAKPAGRPEPAGEESFPGVDPAVLAQCRGEAEAKRLRGEARQLFMKTCVEPED
ncbi:PsiF family protein [Methylobacterium sp. WSM2598]|uniref:PsiF family protein n=1 Tax=Methylobacterium sp. WSM2598 TaxID=398261 RepID=UPI00036AB4D7|nr:PsiF family protein [Methylobacterium sp. WSM2598]